MVLYPFLICLINHVQWRRGQRSEFTPDPEWSGWRIWRPEAKRLMRVFETTRTTLRVRGIQEIKIKEENEVIERA